MIFLAYPGLNGQTSFLSTSINSGSPLTSAEDSILTKIQNSQVYSDIYFVNLQSLALSQVDGRITIQLPDSDCGDLIYYAKTVEYQNEGDYSWYGRLESTADEEDTYCQDGDLMLISSEDGKIGHITIDDKTYELRELSENTFILGKVDNSIFTEWECATGLLDTTSTNFIEDDSPAEQRSMINCNRVRCLVLFTQNALEAEGSINNIRSRAREGIFQTNTILRNSDVRYEELVIEIAGIEQINFTETDIDSDISAILQDPEAIDLRKTNEADIVVLLTNGEYTKANGVAWFGPKKDSAYAIVETLTSTSTYTFAHEVGHLFGANHEQQTIDDKGFNHGYWFRKGGFLGYGSKIYYTVMHMPLDLSNATRIMHFSNPDVKFKKKKTGLKDHNDNARQLRNTACIVAQFEDSVIPFHVRIDGSEFMCPCQLVNFQSIIMGGTAGAVYQYKWYSSSDGINWSTLYNTNPNLSINAPCTEGERLFVKVEVSSSFGGTTSGIKVIEAANEWPRQEAPCAIYMPDYESNKIDLNTVFSIVPNPSTSNSKISYTTSESGINSIFVYNVNGQKVKTILNNKHLSAGNYEFNINMNESGVYFIQSIDPNGNSKTLKYLKFYLRPTNKYLDH